MSGWLDWITHRRRQRAAIQVVLQPATPDRILFLCRGNVCRSPYAVERLHSLAQGKKALEIASAGFISPDRPSPPPAVSAARARGLDLSAHRSVMVDRTRLDAAHLIVAMEAEQGHAASARQTGRGRRVILLGDLDPERMHPRDIEDPMGQSDAVFDRCYDRIDRCVTKLWSLLHPAPGNANAPPDVPTGR